SDLFAQFHVDVDLIRAGAGERFQQDFRPGTHQVDVEENLYERTKRLDHLRAEGNILHEMPIHDIEVEPIGARAVHACGLFCETSEIGGQQRGGNNHARSLAAPAGKENPEMQDSAWTRLRSRLREAPVPAQTAAGAGVPSPGSFGVEGLPGTSGSGVPAGAPCGGSTCGIGSCGVNLPVRTISSTCAPSRVSYSRSDLAIISN